MLPVAATWIWRRTALRAASAAEMSVRSYERAYIRCIVGVLYFIAVLPAAWLSLGYHDAQVQGLLREAMQRASSDVERRHALIAHDLHALGAESAGAFATLSRSMGTHRNGRTRIRRSPTVVGR